MSLTHVITMEMQTATLTVEPVPVIRVVTAGMQGPPGPPGSATAVTMPAGLDLGGQRLVVEHPDGRVHYADCRSADDAWRYAGLTLHAAVTGADVQVQRTGRVVSGIWSWTPGEPVFLGADGALTQTIHPDAVFVLVIGQATGITTLYLDPQPPVILEI